MKKKTDSNSTLSGKAHGTSRIVCPVFGRCGGCSLLDVPYGKQLVSKERFVADLFHDVVSRKAILPILGMDDPFHYRNKVISPYALAPTGKRRQAPKKTPAGSKGKQTPDTYRKGTQPTILTGMYAPGTHRLIPTDACAIENETAKEVTLAIRDIMMRWSMEPYNEDTGRGFVRHAIVRVGHNSGEVLVTVVTNGEEFSASKGFCRELVRRVPAVTSVVQNINTRQTNVILGESERTLYGPGFILDTLCGLSFRISSRSFYQVNARQTEVLYEEAIRLARLSGTETVIDAYCGTGTIGLVAAKRGAARVIGVDTTASAIHDARQNARHNAIENATFDVADATEFMKVLAAEGIDGEGANKAVTRPLVLMMDPPRAGSTPDFIATACALSPDRIVYISCNPKTQKRDVEFFQEGGFEVKALRPVDMFPHTDHVETIVMMEKKHD